MSGPPDILDKIDVVLEVIRPRPFGTMPPNFPQWFVETPNAWWRLLSEVHDQITLDRKTIAGFKDMQDGYSRLYKEVYGSA